MLLDDGADAVEHVFELGFCGQLVMDKPRFESLLWCHHRHRFTSTGTDSTQETVLATLARE